MMMLSQETVINGLLNYCLKCNLCTVCGVDLRNGWQIISPSKSFTVYAATASEKTEWMAHIEKCAQDLLTKRKPSVLCVTVNECH